MRTCVYVDGYNFYYGLLKGTPYKWLDFETLLQHVIHEQTPDAEIVGIYYFTAPCKDRFSRSGNGHNNHAAYIRALETRDTLTVIQGYHQEAKVHLPAAQSNSNTVNLNDKSQVWKLEEKQTDVNLALRIVLDVLDGKCDQIVICSNDTDLEPALLAVQARAPDINIGLLLPRNTQHSSARTGNTRLEQCTNWTRQGLRDADLEAAQLPDKVIQGNKVIRKPATW